MFPSLPLESPLDKILYELNLPNMEVFGLLKLDEMKAWLLSLAIDLTLVSHYGFSFGSSALLWLLALALAFALALHLVVNIIFGTQLDVQSHLNTLLVTNFLHFYLWPLGSYKFLLSMICHCF